MNKLILWCRQIRNGINPFKYLFRKPRPDKELIRLWDEVNGQLLDELSTKSNDDLMKGD